MHVSRVIGMEHFGCSKCKCCVYYYYYYDYYYYYYYYYYGRNDV